MASHIFLLFRKEFEQLLRFYELKKYAHRNYFINSMIHRCGHSFQACCIPWLSLPHLGGELDLWWSRYKGSAASQLLDQKASTSVVRNYSTRLFNRISFRQLLEKRIKELCQKLIQWPLIESIRISTFIQSLRCPKIIGVQSWERWKSPPQVNLPA